MRKTTNNKDPLEVIGRAKGHSYQELVRNLPRHNKFSPILIQKIKSIPEVILRNSGTPFAKKVNKMMREVSTEAYRARQYTRTEINNRGVMFGVVLLKHKVIDLVLEYFSNRFPQCIICLYNEYDHKTTVMDEKGKIQVFNSSLEKIVEYISKDRPIIPYFNDIQFSGEKIFESLYSSQFIPERENRVYFRSMIPDRCFKLPGMKGGVEKRFRNRTINDYLK